MSTKPTLWITRKELVQALGMVGIKAGDRVIWVKVRDSKEFKLYGDGDEERPCLGVEEGDASSGKRDSPVQLGPYRAPPPGAPLAVAPVLATLAPARIPFLCRVCLHRWSEWSEHRSFPETEAGSLHMRVRVRKCFRCGRQQERIPGHPLEGWADVDVQEARERAPFLCRLGFHKNRTWTEAKATTYATGMYHHRLVEVTGCQRCPHRHEENIGWPGSEHWEV